MQKRGQFYIIAAVILISLIYGLTAVENRASGTGNIARFYDLSDNFGKESVKIVDHGVYSKNSQAEIERKLYDFYQNYTEYALARDPDVSIIFVFGDKERAIVGRLNYSEATAHLFGLENESEAVSARSNELKVPSIESVSGDRVIVQIDGERKEFDLKNDESFYFVVMSKKGKEVLVDENA